MSYVVFYDSYGQITKVHSAHNGLAEGNQQEGESILEVSELVEPEDWYVEDATLVRRTPFPDITVSESPAVNTTITVSNLPNDTEVMWPDEVRTRESGSFTFTTDVGDSFYFVLSHARHPRKRLLIDVT